MIDLVACSFPTIDPKLGVTLLNFIEPDKATLEQEVESFYMACGAQTFNKYGISLQTGSSCVE
jgi:hypothetical protein